MIQTINPYATARTAEIMSRYRPIAPKPNPPPSDSATAADNEQNSGGLPNSISKSPYLRNVWANLQARPTRTRKRGRTAAFGPPSSSVVKRSRACLQGLAPPFLNSPANNLAMHGFAHVPGNGQISLVPLKCALDTAVTTLAESVAALPLIHCTPAAVPGGIDLNMELAEKSPPRELDFMHRLKEPVKPSVITPQPVRPVGSIIIVKSISEEPNQAAAAVAAGKKAEVVETELEAEIVPAIISDSGKKVRLANSAYKEMVGQPECCWLDCVSSPEACGGACRRIGGEVVLNFEESSKLMMSMHGFTCRVRIEWGKNSVEALCSAVRIACEGKDYEFLWRFHTINPNDSSNSSSDI